MMNLLSNLPLLMLKSISLALVLLRAPGAAEPVAGRDYSLRVGVTAGLGAGTPLLMQAGSGVDFGGTSDLPWFLEVRSVFFFTDRLGGSSPVVLWPLGAGFRFGV